MVEIFQSRELSEALGLVVFVLAFVAVWGLVALVRRENKGAWGE